VTETVSALTVLKTITTTVLEVPEYLNPGTASVVEGDRNWERPECTRRHIAMLWVDLQRAFTAEVGSALVREVTDWSEDDWTPRIIVAEPDEFREWQLGGRALRVAAAWRGAPPRSSLGLAPDS